MASAVILPEVEDASQRLPRKRRQSSESDNDAKRRRVSHDEGHSREMPASTPAATTGSESGRLAGGQAAEERKRGRRLFGALLGTLSQSSSSSTAQKRRSVIEKKQQDKLKQQTVEADEQPKEKLEALMKIRGKEQRIFDKQSVRFVGERRIHGLRTDSSADEDPPLQSEGASALFADEGRTSTCTFLMPRETQPVANSAASSTSLGN